MKFVILSNKIIPGFNVKGPVMTPMEYDIHQVLKWISSGIDVREVMEDGSYRKLSFNDEKLKDELRKKTDKLKEDMDKRMGNAIDEITKGTIKPNGVIRLKPEKVKAMNVKPVEEKKQEQKKKEVKVQEEPQVDLIIDDLEKPE